MVEAWGVHVRSGPWPIAGMGTGTRDEEDEDMVGESEARTAAAMEWRT